MTHFNAPTNALRRSLVSALLLAVAGAASAEPVTLTAADGAKIFGEFSSAGDKAPIILAFHQAGASRAEYAPLLPRLNKAGFSVLAIDQRSGGAEFGGKNQTVLKLGKSAAFPAALPDLEAALAWGKAKAQGAPVLVWGSSYSAALVFVLAAKHPADVRGVLAFSPGEYLGSAYSVKASAQKLSMPIFVTQSSDEDEIADARAIVQARPSGVANRTQFLPTKSGAHGSSTLRPDRNAAGAEENWSAVLGFLAQFK